MPDGTKRQISLSSLLNLGYKCCTKTLGTVLTIGIHIFVFSIESWFLCTIRIGYLKNCISSIAVHANIVLDIGLQWNLLSQLISNKNKNIIKYQYKEDPLYITSELRTTSI